MNKNLTLLVVSSCISTGLLFYSCEPITNKAQESGNSQTTNSKQSEILVKKNQIIPTITDKKVIYLTFDDGPNNGTQNVMKTIQKNQIPVTMFVIGKHVFGSKFQTKTFNQMKQNQQFQIANHSYSHANNHYDSYYRNAQLVVKDFNKNKETLELKNNIARTPGRNAWRLQNIQYTDLKRSKASIDSVGKEFQVYGWDLEWKYAKNNQLKYTSEQMTQKVDSVFRNNLTQTKNHLVLLTHDQLFEKEENALELYKFITLLQQQNKYEFRHISDYPTVVY